ncbi:hypothetical protein EFB08_11415 [Rufibacter latericius]|uniref:Uncharacterized protein n=2 Tax=Rufibacter latericius TaxID=2487040 RepID=A0A3M9MM95_9BACT|nr:hypothetical protein EFB08_11415 [Rufibacter latericius]
MIPVTQDIFINDPQGRVGNCLQACVASICEMELQDVPHFAAMPDHSWFETMCNWLHDRGYGFEDFDTVNDSTDYMLVIGPSPRGVSHAVVYKDGELAHDPHPSRSGILEVKWCASIYKRKENTMKAEGLRLGQTVYHEQLYSGREAMKIVGLRETEVELLGDYSGGTHNVSQKDWMPIEGVLLTKKM